MFDRLPDKETFNALTERHFAFLAEESFKFLGFLSFEGDQYMAKFAVGPQCQVKWTLERGDFDLYLGPIGAPREWSEGTGSARWFALASLLAFEDELHPELVAPPGQRVVVYTRDVQFSNYAFALKYYLPRLLRVFSAQPPPGWWKGFDEFWEARSSPSTNEK